MTAFWDTFWVMWLLALCADFIAALCGYRYTLTAHVRDRWAPKWWQRGLVTVFALEVFGLHFDLPGHWFSSGWAVAATGLPVAVLIARREKDLMGKVFGWIKKAGGAAWDFTKRRGPIIASAVMGLSFAFPALAPIGGALGAVFGAGGAPANSELSKAIGELIVGLIGIYGAIRKAWALAKPLVVQDLPTPLPK